MMTNIEKPRLLIVDDEQAVLNALKRSLRNDFDILLSLSGPAALQIMREQEIMVLLADQRMPEMTGVEFFRQAQKIQPDSVRVMLTGYSDITAIVEAINDGKIFYYLTKPWDPEALKMILLRAVERYRLLQENRRLTQELAVANEKLQQENIVLRQEVERQYRFDKIIGRSVAMRNMFKLLKKVIPTDTTVMISGETGTGKELVAQAIHYNGPRRNKMFVAQNCAALPDSLLESILFGHVKGAFTDAIDDRKGLFELADGGTVFLDEVGNTSLAFQQRLLRVLQEGEVSPVGSGKTIEVDVRIISATNQDLEKAVADGQFRRDLYYRLNVYPVHLPPLRSRLDDIPLLAEHFHTKYSLKMGSKKPLSPAIVDHLMDLEYPGNVRELENIIERIVVLSDEDGSVDLSWLKKRHSAAGVALTGAEGISGYDKRPLNEITGELEKQYITRSLARNSGNISAAARQLGLSRAGLYKKIKRYNIQ